MASDTYERDLERENARLRAELAAARARLDEERTGCRRADCRCRPGPTLAVGHPVAVWNAA